MKKTLTIILVVLALLIGVLLLLNAITALQIETQVKIDAPKEEVWQVLVANEQWGEWNPFITSSTGQMALGAQITNVMVHEGKENTFTPTITTFEEHTSLEWLGSGMGGMFKGRHYFHLSDDGSGGTTLVHSEEFGGLLSGLIMQMIGEETHHNFEQMNAALKKRVEG